MAGLTAADLLDLADEGRSLDWLSRGLLLASRAWPEGTATARLALPVGVRDRLVLALRVQTFGRLLSLRAPCGACGAELVATVDLADVLAAHGAEPPWQVTVDFDGVPIDVRLPSTGDLLAAAALPDGEDGWELFARCVAATPPGEAAAARGKVAAAIAEADPMTSLELELECHACGARFSEPFDIVTGFWREIEAAADRAALEVHLLASAYGWAERDVLAMSAGRRQRYLALREP
jgi:hypothetical protein